MKLVQNWVEIQWEFVQKQAGNQPGAIPEPGLNPEVNAEPARKPGFGVFLKGGFGGFP